MTQDSIQAVLLAGGLGTRLLPLTQEVPKPMAPVAGIPYLEHQLRLLRKQEIHDILLLVGYLGGQIEQYFSDGSRFGLSIRYSREEEPLGTGGALLQARPLLSATFLLLYGDSYLPIDYRGVVRRLLESDAQAVLVVYDNRIDDTFVPNNVALDEESCILRYEKSSEVPGLTHVDAGVLAMRRSALDLCDKGGAFSLEKELYPKLISRRELLAHQTRQRFYDIGRPEGLKLLESTLTS